MTRCSKHRVGARVQSADRKVCWGCVPAPAVPPSAAATVQLHWTLPLRGPRDLLKPKHSRSEPQVSQSSPSSTLRGQDRDKILRVHFRRTHVLSERRCRCSVSDSQRYSATDYDKDSKVPHSRQRPFLKVKQSPLGFPQTSAKTLCLSRFKRPIYLLSWGEGPLELLQTIAFHRSTVAFSCAQWILGPSPLACGSWSRLVTPHRPPNSSSNRGTPH